MMRVQIYWFRSRFLAYQILIVFMILSCPFLSGQEKGQVIHIDAGEVTTVADGIDGGTGGLEIDQDGNLYTADFGWRLSNSKKGGDKVFKVTPDGKVTLFCRGMRGASGNKMDAKGNLYQSSIGGNYVSRVAPDGQVTLISKQGLSNPVGIALDGKGNLYVCNCGSSSIAKIDKKGKTTVFAKSKLLQCPNGITRAKDGTLYVCNFSNGDVLKISRSGKVSRLATLPGGNNGHLTLLEGYLYVLARSDHRIYKVSLDGKVTYFVGSGRRGKNDGAPGEASLSLPNSIIASPDGKYLYFNETSPISGDLGILGPTRIRRIELKRTVGGPAPQEKVVPQPNTKLLTAIAQAQGYLGKQDFKSAESVLRPFAKQFPSQQGASYLYGYALHSLGRYAKARTYYKQSQAFPQLKANCLYNIACSYSMQKKTNKAIASLRAACAAGYRDFAQLNKDTDFSNIRHDPRFKEIAAGSFHAKPSDR